MDMRSLYYVELPLNAKDEERAKIEAAKANENCLNQNFTILAQKLAELEERMRALES